MKFKVSNSNKVDYHNKYVKVLDRIGILDYINHYNNSIDLIINDDIVSIPVTNSTVIEILPYNNTTHLRFIIGKGNVGTYYSGTDPEFFVEAKGKIIPAFTFLGSKKNPMHKTHGGCSVYWDGFQAEFESRPYACHGYAVDEIQYGLKELYFAAKDKNKNATISPKTLIQVSRSVLNKTEKQHKAFGCMPSLNAYGMKGLTMSGDICPFRSAGGHIHMGMGRMTKTKAIPVVKMLDNILGIAGVSCFAKWDDPRRRRMYGLAGEYRLPKHGIEYRVLSNAWMFHPLTANIFLDLARTIWYSFEHDVKLDWIGNEKETIHIINTCDVKGARHVMARNKKLLLNIIDACYKNHDINNMVYEILTKGVHNFVTNDIVNNWELDSEDWIEHSDGNHANVNNFYNFYYKKEERVIS